MTDPHEHAPPAALSLDLDNLWAYQRGAGNAAWQNHDSFLDLAVPRITETLGNAGLRATIFVCGRDAAHQDTRQWIERLLDAGHDVASHSHAHAPDFCGQSVDTLERDFDDAEAALTTVGAEPRRGFRAPSFAFNETVRDVLARRGYAYDSSLFPTSLGPAASAWERWVTRTTANDSENKYGGFSQVSQPLVPFRWATPHGELYELPVTTMPLSRFPVHWTYLFFLAGVAEPLAMQYLNLHLSLCARFGVMPVLLLHAIDFIGADDDHGALRMPGMKLRRQRKQAFIERTLARCARSHDLRPLETIVDDWRVGQATPAVRSVQL